MYAENATMKKKKCVLLVISTWASSAIQQFYSVHETVM